RLGEIKEKLKPVIDKINELITVVREVHGQLKVLERSREDIVSTMDRSKELEELYTAYEYYMEALSRNGIPYELISEVLPALESEINIILGQMVEFTIRLDMDGKNINGYIVYDDRNVWPIELTSGMERFILSIAIRTALVNVSNLPRPVCIFIDEGFSALDSDNINSVFMLFDYLNTQFEFVLIISHLDAMRDTINTLMEIKRKGDYSKVNFV
ncbi:hypothetical protein LCGC14_2550650, partial [marine sediment metagenome]